MSDLEIVQLRVGVTNDHTSLWQGPTLSLRARHAIDEVMLEQLAHCQREGGPADYGALLFAATFPGPLASRFERVGARNSVVGADLGVRQGAIGPR